jgi:hypothetical protein
VSERIGAERGLSEEMVVNRSLLIARRGAAVFTGAPEIQRVEIRAVGQVAIQTRFAMAAPHVGQHHMVARRNFFDVAADLLNHTRAFVA